MANVCGKQPASDAVLLCFSLFPEVYVLSKLFIQHCELVVGSGLITEIEGFLIINDLLLKLFSGRNLT